MSILHLQYIHPTPILSHFFLPPELLNKSTLYQHRTMAYFMPSSSLIFAAK
jgi:hypothetical protein